MVNTYKVVLCGKTGVGKTSIFHRMCGLTGPLDCKKTVKKTMKDHECHVTVEIDGTDNKVQFNLWDTLGLEEHAQLTRSHFSLSQAVLFVYSATDEDSLSQAAELLTFAKIHAQGACFILIRNKIDLEATVSEADVAKFFPSNPFKLEFKTSALTGDGIQEMLQSVALHLFKKATPMKSIGRHTHFDGSSSSTSGAHYSCNGPTEVIRLEMEEESVPRRKRKCCYH